MSKVVYVPKGYVFVGTYHLPCKWNFCPHCKPNAFKKKETK